MLFLYFRFSFFFFFNDTATTEIYTLSLHDALPISPTCSPFSHLEQTARGRAAVARDRKSTRLNSSHITISYAVFCLKKKKRQYSCSAKSKNKQVRLVAKPEFPCPASADNTGPRLRRRFVVLRIRRPPRSTLLPYTTLFR